MADNALQGAMFWLFQSYSSGANSTASGNINRVDYGIVPSDSTWCVKSVHLHAAQGVSKCNVPVRLSPSGLDLVRCPLHPEWRPSCLIWPTVLPVCSPVALCLVGQQLRDCRLRRFATSLHGYMRHAICCACAQGADQGGRHAHRGAPAAQGCRLHRRQQRPRAAEHHRPRRGGGLSDNISCFTRRITTDCSLQCRNIVFPLLIEESEGFQDPFAG